MRTSPEMEELHYNIVTNPGDLIRVQLKGNAANVLVMDDLNLMQYQAGQAYNYYGGYYTRSPVIIKPGIYGQLNVLINLGGFAGSVNAVAEIVHPRGSRRR
jgi:Domain of unknown function (DUF1883)